RTVRCRPAHRVSGKRTPDGRLAKIVRTKLDRLAVRGAVAGAIPCVAVAMERIGRCHAFLSDELFERVEPVRVISLAGVRVACGLRTFDFGCKRPCPFRPGEDAALMQRQRHGEGLSLPWLTKHRAVGIARYTRHGLCCMLRGSAIVTGHC